jgi:NAD(P)-dependent dehydrogenase (short-subunit alcohol dehydrogenase family)
MNFAGTSTLVTGAASGIGLATARHLAEQGAGRLILVDRDGDALDKVALPCTIERRVGDVADPSLWSEAGLADLDHAVLNAGVPGIGAIVDMPFDEWRRVLSANLDGVFLSLQAALRALRPGGSAVIVASAAGLKPEKNIAAYAASKAAVLQLARVAALEGAERAIRVNAIAPGGVETPIWHGTDWFQELEARHGREGAYRSLAAEGTPLKRFARAQEIAGQIAFLLANEASGFTTGSLLVSDGGYTLT